LIPSSQPESLSGALVTEQVKRINAELRLHPVTASEIEFYLSGAESCISVPGFWDDVTAACDRKGIKIHKTGSETGKEQFEISLLPCTDPAKTARDTYALRDIVTAFATSHGMRANFSAKPFADQPGSGLHIHLHLVDKQNKNVFYKDDDSISSGLQHSIGGLMTWLNPCMPVFAPSVSSYERFVPKSASPLTVSWGANNRTVAIRLPDAAHDNKRIEHRVAGADADPALVIAVILAAVHFGIKNQCEPGVQMFGDATLPMYNLPPIVTTLGDAIARLKDSKLIDGYFSLSDILPNP